MMKQWKIYLIVAIISGFLAGVVKYNDDYMVEKDVHVTFIDKMERNSCHKSNCTGKLYGLFKTDDGIFFDRQISMYMYTQMKVGEDFNLTLRRMDIKQTGWDNVIYFFGVITMSIFVVMLIASPLAYFVLDKEDN